MAEVRLERLAKSFGAQEVLPPLDLTLPAGELCVLVGPSGCGKSTLLRLVAGLDAPTAGRVLIGGRDVTCEDPARRGLAMVFQSYALYPHMSVAENLAFGLEMAGLSAPARQARVRETARALRIEALLDRRPRQLSGGQRQRVAIGRAIIRRPPLLLLDEPLSNLDAELRAEMRVELARLHRELGGTMIHVTHDQVEAMTLATRLVVLRAGRVEQAGRPTDIYDDPDNVFVAGFIGAPRMNLVPARALGPGRVAALGVEADLALAAPLVAGRGLTLGIRPEHLARPCGIELMLRAEVVEQLGSSALVHGAAPDGTGLTAEWRAGRPRAGDLLPLRFDPAELRLFDDQGRRLR
jgi:ABC-type sugar transport system ATPase subunit